MILDFIINLIVTIIVRTFEYIISMECLQYLGRQGIAMQVNEKEQSNFIQLLRLRSRDKSKNSGVATKIPEKQPKAFPTQCHCHSLSLMVKDSTKEPKLLSDVINLKIFCRESSRLPSSSTKR